MTETRIKQNIFRRGNRVLIRARIKGRAVVLTIGDSDDPDTIGRAESALCALRAGGSREPAESPTLNQVILEYWNYRRFNLNLSPNTLRNNLYCLRAIQVRWGRYRLADITTPRLERWVAAMRSPEKFGGPLSPASVNNHISLISTIFAYCIDHDYTIDDPVSALRRFRVNNSRQRYLSREEYSHLLMACDSLMETTKRRAGVYGRLKRLIVLSVFLGLRKGELLSLRRQDIDFDAGYVTLRDTKNGEARHLYLADAAGTALKRELSGRDIVGTSPVFSSHGRPLSPGNLFTAWNNARKQAGLTGFHWHDLRHTYCSWAVMSGVDQATIQACMGHHTNSLTARYTHLSVSHFRESARRLESWVGQIAL